MSKVMAMLIVAVIAAGGVAGYMLMQKTQQATQTGAGEGQQGPGPKGKGQGMGGPGHGGPVGPQQNGTGMANESCNSVGSNNMTIGQNIKWLLDNHNLFNYTLEIYPENMTIVWTITSENRTALETLVSHIRQMECVITSGGTPRPHDPLFVVDAQISSKYVHTEIVWVDNNTVKVIKKADNECAFEVIKLHADVVKGFFDTGRTEAQQTHEIPENVQEICAPYLNQTVGG